MAGRNFAAVLTRPYAGADSTDPARLVGRLTAIASIAAGVIHVSAAGDHTNLPVMLAGFLVVAVLQILVGVLLLWRQPSRLLIAAAVALMLGSVAVWLVSRTSGLPFLEDGHMEPVGFKDATCKLFELASVPGLLLLLSRDLRLVRLPSSRLPSQALGIVASATFALMVPALLLEGGHQHTHEEAVALGLHEGHADTHEGQAAHHSGGGHAQAAHSAGRHAGHVAGGGGQGHTHAGAVPHAHTELAAFHPGHDVSAHSAPGPGEHHAAGRDGGQHRGGHGKRHRRHRHRGGHRGGSEHGHGRDPHSGHEDPEPSDDPIGLEDLPAVCSVASTVTDVCQ